MKVLFVFALLGVSLFLLVVLLDLAQHFKLSEILWKELKPFRVTEQTEITILTIFAIYFILKFVIGWIKRKQGSAES